MAVNAVVDEGTVRDAVNGVHRDRGVDPQKRLFKAVLFHDLPHIGSDPLLIDAVDGARAVEKRQYRRQAVDGDVRLRPEAGLFIRGHERLCGFVLERRNDGRGRVEIQDLRVRNAAHDLLLARRDGKPRRSGKANDLFHVCSSKSRLAASSFSSASARRCSTQYGSSSESVWPISAVRRSAVTSSKAMQCFCPM